ncbi:MAG TPA: glycoside hydrolase family 3 N-terminal domain-containing protein [Thermoleophilaceae bacterium]|nr:glycoside hydrolase family 3 N-terminal domain-containing protein [Thermoleophilaceae bacterium]
MSAPSQPRPQLRSAPERLSAWFAGLEPQDRRLVVLILVLALALVVAVAAVPLLGRSAATTRAERANDSFLTRLIPGPEQVRDEGSVPPEVREAARALSVPEKVDQLLLLGFRGTDADEPERRLARGQLGGLVIAEDNYTGTDELRGLLRKIRARARREDRVPPLLMVSQEGGELSALADLPPLDTPADTASVEEAAAAALNSARALNRIGIDGVLGPVLDIGATDGGPLGLRAFSDSGQEVARYARATVTAYASAGVLSAPLYFPGGLGQAASSTDQGPTQVSQTLDALRRRNLLPFRVAIDAGAQAVVVGHGLYGTDDFVIPASSSRFILNDLLRDELGFDGPAITDDLAAGAITIPSSSAEAGVASIAAGADMVRLSGPPQEQDRLRAAVLSGVRRGRIPRERLDDAVVRVLEAKRAAGLIADAPPVRRPKAPPRRRARPPVEPTAPRRPGPVPGVDRREGRPAGPGGQPGPAPREPAIPGVRRREGRAPGLGGFKPRPRKPKRRTRFQGRTTRQTAPPGGGFTSPGGTSPGGGFTSPGGTPTYTIPSG